MPDNPDPFIGDLVFVYGTLRQGFVNNPATLAFRSGATCLGTARLRGALYAVGWYPALIEGEPGEVLGEVWRIDAAGVMHILDDYEGLFDPGPPEYRRERRDVDLEGERREVWAYIYAHDVDPAHRIPEGDWSAAFNDPGEEAT